MYLEVRTCMLRNESEDIFGLFLQRGKSSSPSLAANFSLPQRTKITFILERIIYDRREVDEFMYILIFVLCGGDKIRPWASGCDRGRNDP